MEVNMAKEKKIEGQHESANQDVTKGRGELTKKENQLQDMGKSLRGLAEKLDSKAEDLRVLRQAAT